MAIILFDPLHRKNLFPFTKTKAIANLRMGIYTIAERWQQLTGMEIFVHTEQYLQDEFPIPPQGLHTWIDASLIPTHALIDKIAGLSNDSCWADETGLILGKTNIDFAAFNTSESLRPFTDIHDHPLADRIVYPWHMMQWNDYFLRFDFDWVSKHKTSIGIPNSNHVIGQGQIFIEPGASVEHCILNSTTGPIYIGKNAVVMEGTAIRGPFAMGEASVLKMNSRIYGATSLGPDCTVGGEIKNSIMMGYSNKAHDGYMGDSVIGEWCNWGAGTSNSNLKNNAGIIKVWVEAANDYLEAGNKCGVMMGDYSRAAINTSINTGSVIGVCTNVFGEGLLPNIIPDFSWGCKGVKYNMDKAFTDIDNWKQLKQKEITEIEKKILLYLSQQ